MELKSNMRNLPEDQSLGSQPAVVKGKMYAATQGQQDQLAEFAANLGQPVPVEHRPENKGHTVHDVSIIREDGVELALGKVSGGFPLGELAVLSAETGVGKSQMGEVAPVSVADLSGSVSVTVTEDASAETAAKLQAVYDEEAPITEEQLATLGQHSDQPFTGFEIPDGKFQLMLMLHPERDAEGNVGEVPQIHVTADEEAWDSWVKVAMKHGLTHGSVTADDEETQLTGFSINVVSGSGDTKRLGFAFNQIAALIPFRDVDEAMLRREQMAAERRAKAARNAKAKKKANKRQAKSRRNNR